MAQILVKSPVTSNGVNPVLDERGQIIYKETVLEFSAKKELDKINTKLPAHLKKIITIIGEPVEHVKAKPGPKSKKDEDSE
jgi:hypothetical protein